MEALWAKLEEKKDRDTEDLLKDFATLSKLDGRNIELLALAVEVSPSLSARLQNQLLALDWTCDQVERLGALVAACVEDMEDLSTLGEPFWRAAAQCAFELNVDAALDVVQKYVRSSTSAQNFIVTVMNGLLAQRKFKPSAKSLQLAETIIANGIASTVKIDSGKVVDACVYTLVRELSNEKVLQGEVLSLVEAFSRFFPLVSCQNDSESSLLPQPIPLHSLPQRRSMPMWPNPS